ncbi:ABC transporter transmembrane region/ABC transporter, putative [Angomonas deanei]|uniref:ABC transporter transmembrane region/ABC transporter, putative n=1 Tax=Angomonas deanei TaxID=59799 RepID=A0A7G2CKN0_9TRYP|nr:ABC transporter transmembrane region/ABC transporter, putative [Angomonas deanei]
MQSEERRVSAVHEGEFIPEDDRKHAVLDCGCQKNILHNRIVYEKELNDHNNEVEELFGEAEEYVETDEDKAKSLLDKFFYTWVRKTIDLASEEKLETSLLPRPTKDVRAYECGLRLSEAYRAAMSVRNAWKYLIGAEVFLTEDPDSRGILRWVGVPQQGGYKSVMAAVEWSNIPAPRAAAEAEDPQNSPLFNGVVHGEHLFDPERDNACTLERTDDVEFTLVPRNSELGVTIPTPQVPSFTRKLFSALPQYFFIQFVFKAIDDVCILVIPVVLGAFVNYISSSDPKLLHGIALVIGLFCIQLIQSTALHRYYSESIRGGLQYRSAMTAVLFEKCFTVSSKSLSRPELNAGRILNMVTTDAERLNEFIQHCMFIWSAPAVFLVSIGLLARLVGWCSLMAVVAMTATLPINTQITKRMANECELLVKVTDMRVKATNEFFSGIRIAKFMTWEPRFIANIEAKRQDELYYLKKVQFCRVLMSFISVATPMIMIAVVFVLYRLLGHDLTPSIVFPTISLLGVIQMPFRMIPYALNATIQFNVAMQRITTFLESDNTSCETVEDVEELYRSSGGAAALPLCASAAVFENLSVTAYLPVKLPFAPKLQRNLLRRVLKMMCCCPSCSKHVHPPPTAVEEPEEPTSTPTTKTEGKKPTMEKDAFYELQPKRLIEDLTVSVPSGKLTVIVGPTGCGKSTLLQVLLGQLEVSSGRVWCCKNIAYVPQQPWIMNATLKDNILFFSEDDEERLTRALEVSQLKADLDILSNGLKTEIGEKGINLSGGQKARVNLARAVYADREMYILDDPLSALDAHVGDACRGRLLPRCAERQDACAGDAPDARGPQGGLHHCPGRGQKNCVLW